MKWFEGSIGEAVSTSKTQNAVFVVYVEGTDEVSRTMTSALDNVSVREKLESNRFVCIKLLKDSEGHNQFSEIYKVVPVPSLFFIGDNGIPLDVVPGDVSQDTVTAKVSTALSKVLGESVPEVNEHTSSPEIPTIEAATASEAVSSSPIDQGTSPTSQVNIEELLKKRREEIKKKEEEKEKEAELRRRQQGQELASARKRQQERELDELRREREREKREEAAARERVLRQIQEDREARLARQQASSRPSSQPEEEKVAPPLPSPRPASPPSNSTRIQFKLPDSSTRTSTFLPTDTIQDLRSYVDANITLPFKEYTLATTFPRREFTARDLDRNLISLELVPSGVILIMPLSRGIVSTRTNWGSMIWAMFMDLIQPLFAAGRYLRSFVSGSSTTLSPGSEPSSTSSQQPTAPSSPAAPKQTYPPPNAGSGRTVRKRGNIHTLHDGDDSNDENNTWNGNSTQLM